MFNGRGKDSWTKVNLSSYTLSRGGGKQHTVCDSGGGTCKIVLTVAQISTVGVELFVVCLDASTGFVECAELH